MLAQIYRANFVCNNIIHYIVMCSINIYVTLGNNVPTKIS